MTVVPVIPPDLRPLVPLDGGRFATSDLNDLYRRVINRNNRLKRLIELRAPDIIIRNEKRMLQEAVDALFDNGRRGRVITGANKRPLKSLSDMLKGKQGRFRQNLLGKRVDYSGRSVIVVGPELKLHQCGLPKKMALELFKPFIYSRLDAKGFSSTVKQAKKLVEKEKPEVWDILDEVIREHPVLLNRAPTLHRLGIQAFEPVLIEGKAIQLHPLVCAAFNADFDGDQMAVHVPLSLEAQLEARVLMMSTNNILHPANGQPIIVPSQDIVLGLYYLSIMAEGEPGEGMAFGNIGEIEHALAAKAVTLHTKISGRFTTDRRRTASRSRKIYETTPGRMLLGDLLPQQPERALRRRQQADDQEGNLQHDRRRLPPLRSEGDGHLLRPHHGARLHPCVPGRHLVRQGRHGHPGRPRTSSSTRPPQLAKEYEQQYNDGLITQGEKYNKVVDAWAKCTDKVADEMMKRISAVAERPTTGRQKPMNSIYMMTHSGARGSPAQMKQLAGMRGLMAKPSGEIIETPIISNFKEGLTVLEYFNSTHGARKGLADTALKTANSGYLTRRLVDVAQDCIVTEQDCGTDGRPHDAGDRRRRPGRGDARPARPRPHRGRGRRRTRRPARSSCRPGTHHRRARRREDREGRRPGDPHPLGADLRDQERRLRQVLRARPCPRHAGQHRRGGRRHRRPVDRRAGHAAHHAHLPHRRHGAGGRAVDAGVELRRQGRRSATATSSRDSDGRLIAMGRNMQLVIVDRDGTERAVAPRHLRRAAAGRRGRQGEARPAAGRMGSLHPADPHRSRRHGRVRGPGRRRLGVGDDRRGDRHHQARGHRLAGQPARQRPQAGDRGQGQGRQGAQDGRGGAEARYLLSVDAILSVEPGAEVKAGDVLARIPLESAKTRDITGGLPRVAELFEARRPKDHAIIAEIDGTIQFGRDYKNKRRDHHRADARKARSRSST